MVIFFTLQILYPGEGSSFTLYIETFNSFGDPAVVIQILLLDLFIILELDLIFIHFNLDLSRYY